MQNGQRRNSQQIEKIAINHLELALYKCGCIQTEFGSNDKTLSWDGVVYLYNSEINNKKEDLIGKCEVQIKGRSIRKKEKRDKISFSIEKTDLINYRRNGGVMFFVIEIDENLSTQIYYNSLLPYDLVQIIEKIDKKNQKSYSVLLDIFPTKAPEIKAIINNFIRDKSLQFGTTPDKIDDLFADLRSTVEEGRELVFWANPQNLINDNNMPLYLYSKYSQSAYVPVAKISIESIGIDHKTQIIKIDNTQYFSETEVKYEVRHDEITIKIGPFVTIIQDKEGRKKTQINFSMAPGGSPAEAIEMLQFAIALNKFERFEIVGFMIASNINNKPTYHREEELLHLKKDLAFFEKLEALFSALRIKRSVNVALLTQADKSLIEVLYKHIVEQEYDSKSGDEVDSANLVQANIENLKILLIMIIKKDMKMYINYFNPELTLHAFVDGIEVSAYLKLTKEDLLTICNINLHCIMKAIRKIGFNKAQEELANPFLLEMLQAYDAEPDIAILKAASELATWLYENRKSDYNFLNMMQTLRRERLFKMDEKEKILNIIEDTDNIYVNIGGCALLEDSDRYQFYLKRLSHEEQKSIESWPIVRFLDDLGKESGVGNDTQIQLNECL